MNTLTPMEFARNRASVGLAQITGLVISRLERGGSSPGGQCSGYSPQGNILTSDVSRVSFYPSLPIAHGTSRG